LGDESGDFNRGFNDQHISSLEEALQQVR